MLTIVTERGTVDQFAGIAAMVKPLLALLLSAAVATAQFSPGNDQAFLGQFFPSSAGPGDLYATGWAARVVANGGAAPSAGTKSAISTFVNMLNTANITNKMIAVNVVAPDNIIAARTPLFYTLGTDPWAAGASFLVGGLSTNGWTGSGISTGYLDLGFTPNDISGKNTNIGYTIYYYTAPNEAKNDFGCFNATPDEYGLSFVNNTHRGMSGPFPGGRFDVSNAGFGANPGFISYNITTNVGKFWGGSSAGFAQVGGNDNTLGADASVTRNYYAWTQNGNSGPQAGNQKTLSFVAVHRGLTQVEASNLWYSVQVLRTNLGGGYR